MKCLTLTVILSLCTVEVQTRAAEDCLESSHGCDCPRSLRTRDADDKASCIFVPTQKSYLRDECEVGWLMADTYLQVALHKHDYLLPCITSCYLYSVCRRCAYPTAGVYPKLSTIGNGLSLARMVSRRRQKRSTRVLVSTSTCSVVVVIRPYISKSAKIPPTFWRYMVCECGPRELYNTRPQVEHSAHAFRVTQPASTDHMAPKRER